MLYDKTVLDQGYLTFTSHAFPLTARGSTYGPTGTTVNHDFRYPVFRYKLIDK